MNRTTMVMDAIRTRIAGRLLAGGDRLPSVRQFATVMQVSPATVVEAYDRLVVEGLVRAVPRSGFFVTHRAAAPQGPAGARPPRVPEIDPFWVSRQSLDGPPQDRLGEVSKPGCGWLPPDWLPQAALRKALREAAQDADALVGYGSTRGDPALRRHLALRFAGEGLHLGLDQILLTGSGTQAIDLICRFLLRPGDTVLVDDPCYFNFQAMLAAHKVRLVAVPYGPGGPDPARFEAIVKAQGPRLYITNSALHNPTGATLSPQAAHRLPAIAAAHGMTIVEDEIFADLEPEPSPRMAVLDGLASVIRIGSFSKTLSASVRCGYIAARPEWIEALVDLQVATSFVGPSPLAAAAIARVLASGAYRRHIDDLRRRLSRARLTMAERLGALGIEPWLMPRGGFQLWCKLPNAGCSASLAQACLREGVVLAPGNVFSPTHSAGAFARFNVVQTTDAALNVIAAQLNP